MCSVPSSQQQKQRRIKGNTHIPLPGWGHRKCRRLLGYGQTREEFLPRVRKSNLHLCQEMWSTDVKQKEATGILYHLRPAGAAPPSTVDRGKVTGHRWGRISPTANGDAPIIHSTSLPSLRKCSWSLSDVGPNRPSTTCSSASNDL